MHIPTVFLCSVVKGVCATFILVDFEQWQLICIVIKYNKVIINMIYKLNKI